MGFVFWRDTLYERDRPRPDKVTYMGIYGNLFNAYTAASQRLLTESLSVVYALCDMK